MSLQELQPGASANASLSVGEQDLASTLSLEAGDGFPPVLATSRMIALMEIAASRAMRPLLQAGELSVGVTVEITHTAATPQGVAVIATARYTGRDGKLFVFDVSAGDPAGPIGQGTHKRAIVRKDRLMEGATRRSAAPRSG